MAAPDILAISRARTHVADGSLKTVREQAQLSQADLARALGVSQACVSRWESQERQPNSPVAERLGHLLELLERMTAA